MGTACGANAQAAAVSFHGSTSRTRPMMIWHGEVKRTVERGLISSGLPALSRRSRSDGVVILAYHNIVPAGVEIVGDRSLHLPVSTFAAQLDSLRTTHDIVPLESVLDGEAVHSAQPRAVITFDDAYRGAVTSGIEEVVKRGLPATIFVAPAFVGGRFFWWDAITEPGAAGPTEACRGTALEACGGKDEAVRRWAEMSGHPGQVLPDAAACASESELRAALEHPGITLASHSWSHPNLVRLTPGEVDQELVRPLVWLRQRFNRVLPVLSYPYGLSSPAVERAVASAGYRAAFRVTGGWMSSRSRNPFALPRWNVPAGLSHDGFLLRTAGLFCR